MKWNGWLSFPNVFVHGNGPYIVERVIGFGSGVRRHVKMKHNHNEYASFCSGHSLFCWPWMVLDRLGGGIQQNNGHSTSLLLSKTTKSEILVQFSNNS